MASMTEKEYRIRMAWLEMQWNEPSRTDHYIIQLTQVVARILAKNPRSIKLTHFILKFITEKDKEREQRTAARKSKETWFQLLGISDKLKK